MRGLKRLSPESDQQPVTVMRRQSEPVELTIDNLSHEGRGVGRIEGKTVFVHGALPGEKVQARIRRKHPKFDEAEVVDVIESSSERIEPRCEYFGICGGCSMQHVNEAYQLRHKQDLLIEMLHHQAGIVPDRVAAPIRGPQWGYRRKARLGVKRVPKKGGVLVGFRERAKPYITDCTRCDILDPRIGEHLPDLRALIGELSIPAGVPQIEVALGDAGGALVIRHLEPLSGPDHEKLQRFASNTGFAIWTQSRGLDSVVNIDGGEQLQTYQVDGLSIAFGPTDFIQINAHINEQMVARALDYLEPKADDRIVDLFCGIGNFTLPIARRADEVTGVEGDAMLVSRASSNAQRNELMHPRFVCADLSQPETIEALNLAGTTKLLLDPPRTGARAVLDAFPIDAMTHLVYVSCNPVTFARDASQLVRDRGFRLVECGVLDMFPQTSHVESIALFERR